MEFFHIHTSQPPYLPTPKLTPTAVVRTYSHPMRDRLAGAIFLLFCATVALAQPTGDIESIGFGGGAYRPGCWTPMVLKISPNNAPSGTYQIQVKQRDEDNDVAIFT